MKKVLVINPGSTSTKIALYNGVKELIIEGIRHPNSEIDKYESIIDQYEYRKKLIIKVLEDNGHKVSELDAVVGRGGLLNPLPDGGTYQVNSLMLEHLKAGVGGEHASNLGALIADSIASEVNIPAFIVDPVIVDEMTDIAKYTGIPEIQRKSIWHVLNQKAIAREYAKKQGKKYSELNLIIAHLGGGISVGAHKKGRTVDVNNALNGDGPFTPTRAGSIPALQLVEMALSGKYNFNDFKAMLSKKGGLIAHLGTHDALEINERIYAGEKKATDVFKAMAYNLAKEITGLIPAFDGEKCDQVILTGGLAKDDILIDNTKAYLKSSGLDITVMPGEFELEGLRDGALRVLAGEETPQEYKG